MNFSYHSGVFHFFHFFKNVLNAGSLSDTTVSSAWVAFYKKREEEKKKSNDMLLNQWGKTAGGQEEFQIFDKHVKAVKPGLVIMPSLLLPCRCKGINFSDPPPPKKKEKKMF